MSFWLHCQYRSICQWIPGSESEIWKKRQQIGRARRDSEMAWCRIRRPMAIDNYDTITISLKYLVLDTMNILLHASNGWWQKSMAYGLQKLRRLQAMPNANATKDDSQDPWRHRHICSLSSGESSLAQQFDHHALCKSEGVVFQECSIQSVEGRYGWWPSQAHLALRLAPKDWFRSSLSSMMSSLSWIWWLGNLGVGFLLAHVSHCLPQSLHSAIEQDLLIAASEFQLHSSVWQVLICFQDFPRTISKLKDSRVRRAPCLGALFTKKNWFSARMWKDTAKSLPTGKLYSLIKALVICELSRILLDSTAGVSVRVFFGEGPT